MNSTSNAKWVLLFTPLLNVPWAIVQEQKVMKEMLELKAMNTEKRK